MCVFFCPPLPLCTFTTSFLIPFPPPRRAGGSNSEPIDVTYANIQNALFQHAENEVICLLHFHLWNPIIVGKKKTKDIQFYSEVMEAVQSLDQSRRSRYDPDEIEEEQRERHRRNRINKDYKVKYIIGALCEMRSFLDPDGGMLLNSFSPAVCRNLH